jgi:tetratricopeptide (TPR) repeat protein
MSQSFRPWAPDDPNVAPLPAPLVHVQTGFNYSVVEENGRLYQVESLRGPDGRRIHELRRRVDYVMGSGAIAETYFTEENGRLFQLPLTWYRDHGWDYSPGYELNNARFDRVLPDRCIACHANYPQPLPHLEGKYAELRPGIGCERCHGPGALHVRERQAATAADTSFDPTIVNPARLPLARRLDVCEQCHVHAPVTVLREGEDHFSYLPSERLSDHVAFFKVRGSIDIVSHADRLRQSACFIATRASERPLECATCHNPHSPVAERETRNQSCAACHDIAALGQQMSQPAMRDAHAPGADCVSCHMPSTRQRTVPHGVFTDHWIRVVRDAARDSAPARESSPIEAYFARDASGPQSAVYQGMGLVVYATLANDFRALAEVATTLDERLGNESARGEAHFLLGIAYQQLGRTDQAIRALQQSLRADSSRPDRLRALAQSYEAAGRPVSSIDSLYRRALDLQPALAWIRADYATFLQSSGNRRDAITHYERALDEQPSLAMAWFNLGTAFAELNARTEASQSFREALRLDPRLGRAMHALVEVITADTAIARIAVLEPPLPAIPVRAAPQRAVQIGVSADGRQVSFSDSPPQGVIIIHRPDGAIIKALQTAGGGAVQWDLRAASGRIIGGGLYRARVTGRDARGNPLPPQTVDFGVIRRDAR